VRLGLGLCASGSYLYAVVGLLDGAMAHRDAWDSSAAADMAARPRLSTTMPWCERAEEGERGKEGRKVCDVALTCGTHR
jgi:hypothetical protein